MGKSSKLEQAKTVKTYTWLFVGIGVLAVLLILFIPPLLEIVQNLKDDSG